MTRPKCCRKIGVLPSVHCFRPEGSVGSETETVYITLDEVEAIKLADYRKLYQEEAAGLMNVSRQTFGRIIQSAHHKIADAIINGKTIEIKGGAVELSVACRTCGRTCQCPAGDSEPECPRCRKKSAQ